MKIHDKIQVLNIRSGSAAGCATGMSHLVNERKGKRPDIKLSICWIFGFSRFRSNNRVLERTRQLLLEHYRHARRSLSQDLTVGFLQRFPALRPLPQILAISHGVIALTAS